MDTSTSTIMSADRRIPDGGDWLSKEELAQLTPTALRDRMLALAPLAAQHAREAEELRRPVDAVWNAIRKSGFFYQFVPKKYGGLEATPEDFVAASLPLAESCPSTAWVATFCAEHNWILAHFPAQTQDEIWGGAYPYIVAPFPASPPGVAKKVAHGYQVTGHWRWGTGVMHADWILANAMTEFADGPQPGIVLFRAEQAAVLDTWHVDGMIGTGSNDIVVKDLFIPEHHAIPLAPMQRGRSHGPTLHDGPIYRMPALPFLGLTASIAALGAARIAITAYHEKLAAHVKMGQQASQAQRPAAQIRLARAELMTQSATTLAVGVARDLLVMNEIEEPEQTSHRIRARATLAYAVDLCRQATQILCESAGSSAHGLTSPLQRAWRDVNVIGTHVVFDIDTANELYGRSMLGLPPNSFLI
jgi:alkylation response protein AidB-like acyl-CoA dehydrogenase